MKFDLRAYFNNPMNKRPFAREATERLDAMDARAMVAGLVNMMGGRVDVPRGMLLNAPELRAYEDVRDNSIVFETPYKGTWVPGCSAYQFCLPSPGLFHFLRQESAGDYHVTRVWREATTQHNGGSGVTVEYFWHILFERKVSL